jgi:N-carbamoylputrescine amidase
MRVTVCELPHEPYALAVAWSGLCEHTRSQASQLVLLPEFAMVEAVWESPWFDAARWSVIEALSVQWLDRLHELGAEHVVGTRPVRVGGRRLNQGYLWSAATGATPLRSKYFMPEEPWSWEATWLDRGDAEFPVYHAGDASFAVNICTELWALETYANYARRGVELLLSPRATGWTTKKRWLALGMVAAMRSGAFSLSSNRIDPSGACGGTGWIIDPTGDVLATTTRAEPFATLDIDLAEVVEARYSYPRYAVAKALY